MRGRFPAPLVCALALAACGGVVQRSRPEGSAGTSAGEPPPPAVDSRGVAGAPPQAVDAQGSAGAPPQAEACGCVDVNIAWWVDTGLAPPTLEGHITPCNAFSYGPAGAPECRTVLDDCSQVFTITRLSAALAKAEVREALARSPVLYGRDLRGKGGQVDHLEIDGKVIEIGADCDASEPCSIPDDLTELARLLWFLAAEQGGSCTPQ